jgi:hypothetical protein
MPKMLRTIVEDLLSLEQDIVVVGRSEHQSDVLRDARDEGADMLITQSGQGARDTSIDAILSAAPLEIFAIGADGTQAAVINLTRRAIALDGDKQAVLSEAIRQAACNLRSSFDRGARWLG